MVTFSQVVQKEETPAKRVGATPSRMRRSAVERALPDK